MPDCVLDTGATSVNKTAVNILECTDGLDLEDYGQEVVCGRHMLFPLWKRCYLWATW